MLGDELVTHIYTHTHLTLCRVVLIIVYLCHLRLLPGKHERVRRHTAVDMNTSSLAVIHTVTRQQVLSPHEVIIAIILSPCRGTSMSADVCVCILNPCHSWISSELESLLLD